MINKKRRIPYSRLSDGQSLRISNQLIMLERLALFSSHIFTDFDGRARPFQEAGISIVCDEYIDMKHTPAFQSSFPQGPPDLSNYRPPNTRALKRDLRNALKTDGLRGLHEAVEKEIAVLKLEPRMNCMLRHMLESMARIAALAPHHESAALAKGLPSTLSLSTDMIDSHFLLLARAIELDRAAAPLQARNIPILCQDVPPIPDPGRVLHSF